MRTLYSLAIMERKPAVMELYEGVSRRLANVTAVIGETPELRAAIKQFGKVSRCVGSYERTHGKTFNNLFLASAKLEKQILELEHQAMFHGACHVCDHQKHIAGKCSHCNCGASDVVGGY